MHKKDMIITNVKENGKNERLKNKRLKHHKVSI
jgi:hypothetical protein